MKKTYKHEKKYCPRCKTAFECKVGSILLCQCSKVEMSESERKYVADQYEDCLCAGCMEHLKIEYHIQSIILKSKKHFNISKPHQL